METADPGAIRVPPCPENVRDEMVAAVYPQMRRIAQAWFGHERPNHTLQATALVHEAIIRLIEESPFRFTDRAHLYATACRQMRHILVDYGRRYRRRRAAHASRSAPVGRIGSIPAVEMALLLDRLESIDGRAAEIVGLRVWGGLSSSEIGAYLGISVSTVRRDWDFGRLWLKAEFGRPACH